MPAPIRILVVAGVVLQKDGKYLLVQEAKQRARGLWNWPAGKVEEGMTITETAIKEAKEESGYNVELVREIAVWHEEADAPAEHVFEARIISGELKFPPDEILDARWFTFAELQGMRDQLRGQWILGTIEKLTTLA